MSSFGVGGTNAHVVLKAAAQPLGSEDLLPVEVLFSTDTAKEWTWRAGEGHLEPETAGGSRFCNAEIWHFLSFRFSGSAVILDAHHTYCKAPRGANPCDCASGSAEEPGGATQCNTIRFLSFCLSAFALGSRTPFISSLL